MTEQTQQAQQAGQQPTQQSLADNVVELLYEMPLGGEWHDLQEALCAYWTGAGAEPQEAEVEKLSRHFARAITYLERVPAEQNRWFSELYRLPLAACVVDNSGKILDANARGRELLGSDAHDIPLDALNQRHLADAVEAARAAQLGAATLRIIGAEGEHEVRVYLNQIPSVVQNETDVYLGIMVDMALPDVGLRLLADQYQLTPAEARLCLDMSGGKSLDDVAQAADVKKTTLRTHLSRCFQKLGVRSQPELVALVLHHMFAGAQLAPTDEKPPRLTPYLDPEIHGFPKFSTMSLSDGRKLGYFEYGDRDGVPVIYCHGSFETGLFMKSQRLTGHGVRLIVSERGGVGESSVNPDPSPAAYAKDLIELADHLDLAEYAVMGRSMGSWDATTLAMQDPQRAKLILYASCRLPVVEETDHETDIPFYRSLFKAVWTSDTMGRLMIELLRMQLLVRGPEGFIQLGDRTPIERELSVSPTFLRHVKSSWLRCGMHGAGPIHEHLKLYRDPVRDPPWFGLQTPAILVHGEEDKVISIDRVMQQTASFVNRQLVTLPGIGHMTVHLALGEMLGILRQHWDSRVVRPQRVTS